MFHEVRWNKKANHVDGDWRRAMSAPAVVKPEPMAGPLKLQRRSQRCKTRGQEAVVGPAAAALDGDHARVDELLHVVADGGRGELEGVGKVAGADVIALAPGEDAQQLQAGGVAEESEPGGEVLCPGLSGAGQAGAGAALIGCHGPTVAPEKQFDGHLTPA